MNQQVLKVALVDRSPILRAGIKALLSNQSHLELVFGCGSVKEFLEQLSFV